MEVKEALKEIDDRLERMKNGVHQGGEYDTRYYAKVLLELADLLEKGEGSFNPDTRADLLQDIAVLINKIYEADDVLWESTKSTRKDIKNVGLSITSAIITQNLEPLLGISQADINTGKILKDEIYALVKNKINGLGWELKDQAGKTVLSI